MPKVLIYIVKKIMWVFLFYNTDFNDNRAHVHVGKKGTAELSKIWLEPTVEVDKKGDLNESQLKEILGLVELYREQLMAQWKLFKEGKQVKTIKIKK